MIEFTRNAIIIGNFSIYYYGIILMAGVVAGAFFHLVDSPLALLSHFQVFEQVPIDHYPAFCIQKVLCPPFI